MKPEIGAWIRLAAVLVAVVAAGRAFAGDVANRPLGVVELFTSQGCNSCPKADAVFADMAREGEVVALAYHVDYWDYLGWRDTLGSADNTQRQRDYARMFGDRSVYTPQAVVNGRRHLNGSSRPAIDAALGEMSRQGKGMSVDVAIERMGDTVLITVGQAAQSAGRANVKLVYFDPARPVEITRGENQGSTITYWNAVTGFQTAGVWTGQPARFEMPASEIDRRGGGGCAVLLQKFSPSGVPGPIIGAAVLAAPGS